MKITHNNFYDVIISGGGPVGLFLACELALAKCTVLILEKNADPHSPLKQLPFGIRGLSAPSIEALYRRNLLYELELHKRLKSPHQHADEGARRQVGHFAGIPFFAGDIDTTQWATRLPSDTETSLISEIAELETVLTRRAQAQNVTILKGKAVTGFEQTEEGVTVQCDNEAYSGKWLVGCDGSRSVIRKAGGFDFAGTEPEFTGYTAKVTLADPEKLKPGRNTTATGMYMQSQPGYLVIQDFDGGAFHSSRSPITRDHLQYVLQRVSGTDITLTELHLATTWTDRARQATTYRNGRVLLAGDAAHIHAPLGGQGLNLGLGDAMNLGWKLAATIHDTAPAGLLDTYYTERYPIGEEVLNWSRAQVALMKPDVHARALNAIIRDLISTHDGATYFAGRVWGVNLHYNLSGTHSLTGYSMPNFEFETGTTAGELLHTGLGLLMDFDGDPGIKWLAGQYQRSIRYSQESIRNSLGLSALLVRPDGIIAWAAEGQPDITELESAMARWFTPG